MKLTLILLLGLALGQSPVEQQQQSGQRDAAAQDGGQLVPHDPERNRSYRPSEVDRKARVLSRPAPHYPRGAMNKGVEGTVSLRLLLTSTGKVSQVSIIKGLPEGLTEAAVKAAYKIKFEPAVKDGRKVSQWATIQYNFAVSDD